MLSKILGVWLDVEEVIAVQPKGRPDGGTVLVLFERGSTVTIESCQPWYDADVAGRAINTELKRIYEDDNQVP